LARGYWASVVCGHCGLAYAALRAGITFAEAYREVFSESREACQSGDYGKPADRRAALGRMFQYKQGLWNEHLRQCDEAAAYAAEDDIPF